MILIEFWVWWDKQEWIRGDGRWWGGYWADCRLDLRWIKITENLDFFWARIDYWIFIYIEAKLYVCVKIYICLKNLEMKGNEWTIFNYFILFSYWIVNYFFNKIFGNMVIILTLKSKRIYSFKIKNLQK